MPTFLWGDIPQTITIDANEMTMTRLRAWSSTKPGGSAKVELKGDTLMANFGFGGKLSLTPICDGATALVRLNNKHTAIFHKVSQ